MNQCVVDERVAEYRLAATHLSGEKTGTATIFSIDAMGSGLYGVWHRFPLDAALGKSLLDIQREEAQQAKARTEAETAHQAAGMSAAPRAPSSWGKVVAQAPASQGELPFTAEDSNRDVMPEMVATEGGGADMIQHDISQYQS